MDTMATVLIKVKVGSENYVKNWLVSKMENDRLNRHCNKAPRNCALCTNEELEKSPEDRNDKKLPCEHLEIKVLAYLSGPFDFALVSTMVDVNIIEDFLVKCLRGWEIKDHILDTQTLTGITIEKMD